MAATITYTNPSERANNVTTQASFASGKAVCDGTEVTIECGFTPTKIVLIIESGATDLEAVWVSGMEAGYYFDGAAVQTSAGPTVGDGNFVIPDTLAVDTDVIYWQAYR
jgi:hypothetical protein